MHNPVLVFKSLDVPRVGRQGPIHRKALPMTPGDLVANGFQTAHLGYEEAGLAWAANDHERLF
jgi:hypothetical protein